MRVSDNRTSAVPMNTTQLPLTESQQQAMLTLTALAGIYFKGIRIAGLRPNANTLIVGPSGAGKTHLVNALADRLGLPVLKLTVGDWLVTGARTSEPITMERVQTFVGSEKPGIIFIDELDKMRAHDNAWSLSIITEVYGLLDRRVGTAGSAKSPWTEKHTLCLRDRIFFIGAGTWMDLWTAKAAQKPRRTIGFQSVLSESHSPGRSRDEVLKEIRDSQVIPLELMNRFNPEWLVLDPYTAADFRQLSRTLELSPGVIDPEAGAASGLNFRYVLACLTRAALAAERLSAPTTQLHLWETKQ